MDARKEVVLKEKEVARLWGDWKGVEKPWDRSCQTMLKAMNKKNMRNGIEE
jgi:hypothetical protein